MTVRTRFAPSPTGYLHIGGARTALFSWLYARKHGGTFILRIEDTALERSTTESINAILEGMTWLGLEYAEGQAYRCYCSKERLEELRETQMANKEKPRYDGRCRHLTAPPPGAGEYVVRFKNPTDDAVVVDDQVRGRVVFQNSELDDLIIARSDGTPTYNFTVVVDDLDMRVTHVIRGDVHLNITPRQMNILRALGAMPPVYANLPMILGEDGKRLSKRHGAVSVMQFREEGYLPEAVLNYLVRLGWSHGDQEIFPIDEMIRLFDIPDINNSASSINPGKLLWLNQHYMKTGDPAHVAHHLSWHVGQLGLDPAAGPVLTDVVQALRERTKTLKEMAEQSACFYREVAEYDPAAAKHLSPAVAEPLADLRRRLADLPEWTDAALHEAVIAAAEAFSLKMGKIAQPLRVALTGTTVSPPIDITLRLIGRERALQRIDRALAQLRAMEKN